MEDILVYPTGTGEAIGFAAQFLKQNGISVVDHPTPEVTHLLLDTPCREYPWTLLERLPEDITVVGGNLDGLDGYRRIDLLKEEGYLCRNAAITAECALLIAAEKLKLTFRDAPVLVIGWGRIGKCLADLLKGLDCPVTVAARKTHDRAMLAALGYHTAAPGDIRSLKDYRVVFNTVPAVALGNLTLELHSGCLEIELASSPGLTGRSVIPANGLPGRLAPESSGKLIADTFLRHIREGTI